MGMPCPILEALFRSAQRRQTEPRASVVGMQSQFFRKLPQSPRSIALHLGQHAQGPINVVAFRVHRACFVQINSIQWKCVELPYLPCLNAQIVKQEYT